MSKGYVLQNEFLKVEVAALGAELTSIINLENNKEYLWQADAKYWKRHAPVLFPIVGSLKDKQYTFEKNTYEMSQHGFARDLNFEITQQTAHSLWQFLESNERTKAVYPFDFKLEIGYELKEKTITVIWKITNEGNEKMYYSIGAHPAFNCPLNSAKSQTDYYIGFETEKETLDYGLLNAEGLLTNESYQLPLENGHYKITSHLFDQDALIIENHQVQKVWLADENKKPYVTVIFDAPLFGLWSPAQKEAPFVCIEPWYGRCDKADFNGTLEEREWGNTLLAGETQEFYYQIIID